MLGFQNNFNAANNSLSVEMFIMVQTGTYQPEVMRPFTASVNEQVIQDLRNATNDGQNLNAAAVQQVAANIIAPKAQAEGEVNIVNGWTSRRFRFIMKVSEESRFIKGTRTSRIFFGCSDHCDVSYGDHLDPNMRLYFNSETVIAERPEQTVHGLRMTANILGSNQILSPSDVMSTSYQNGMNIPMYGGNTSYLQRPEDIFSIQQSRNVATRLQNSGMFNGPIDKIIDQRTSVGEAGTFQYSHRRDTSPTRFLSSTLNGWQSAVREYELAKSGDNDLTFSNDFSYGISNEVMYGTAQSTVQNQDIHYNTFLARLKEHAGYMERGYILLKDLWRLFPETQSSQVTKFSMDNGQSIRKVNFAEHAQHWNGADYNTVAASMLAQVVPAIMMDNYFRVVSFAITNGHGPNNYLFEIHSDGTRSIVNGLDMLPSIREFERRLIIDAINSISMGNQIAFKISMHSDLGGDSVIDISTNNDPVERFVAPTFIDSLFSPVLTRNDKSPELLSNDLTYLVQEVIPTSREASIITDLNSNQPFMQGYQHPVAAPSTFNHIPAGENNEYAINFHLL